MADERPTSMPRTDAIRTARRSPPVALIAACNWPRNPGRAHESHASSAERKNSVGWATRPRECFVARRPTRVISLIPA
eukprot:3225500-Prymnesium_polylepis.3